MFTVNSEFIILTINMFININAGKMFTTLGFEIIDLRS